MYLKSAIRSNAMQALASPRVLELQRQKARWSRKLRGAEPVVHYFHQVDDPYSHLCAHKLAEFAESYNLQVTPHLVSTPPDAYLGDASRYWQWAANDAAAIAPGYGLRANFSAQLCADSIGHAQEMLAQTFPGDTKRKLKNGTFASRFATTALEVGTSLWAGETFKASAISNKRAPSKMREGNRLRTQLGHFLGAMFWFDGEWYWGLDRLHLLERRLQKEGFADSSTPLTAPPPTPPTPPTQNVAQNHNSALEPELTLEYFPSLRSPYSAVGQPRVEAMLSRLNVALKVKPVMPMLMRGIPAPQAKQRYILQDAAREARFLGVPFGNFVDPFGEPVKRAFALYPEAQRRGKAMEFVSAYLNAAFAIGTNITRTEGLAQVARAAGLSYAELAAGDNSNWQQVLETNLQQMLEAGLWGVPSFRLTGGKSAEPFCCWGQDRLWLLEAEIYRRCQAI